MSDHSEPEGAEGELGVEDAGAHSVAAADERTPILIHSNAPWVGSGYGAQAGLFGPLLQERIGYRVAFSAFYGLRGSRLAWASKVGEPYVIYPASRDGYGNDVIGAHFKHWSRGQGGLLITITDPWVLATSIMAQLPTLSWCPVDHDPLIPGTKEWFQKSGAQAIAMTRWGEQIFADAGIKAHYVPHGFDPDIFFPQRGVEPREILKLPKGAFVVSMVAANKGQPSRKSFSEAIQAFAIFREKHTDAVLYLHTKMEDPDGETLPELCEAVGVRPYTPDQYGLSLGAPAETVAVLMNSTNVLLNPARGEGFGVPLIEAQACGTPCITTNFSAMPEVAPESAGNWTVEGQRVWTNFDSFQITPSIEDIVDKLTQAYEEPQEDRIKRSVSVAQWAHDNYRANDVTDKFWDPVLQACAEEINWRMQKMASY